MSSSSLAVPQGFFARASGEHAHAVFAAEGIRCASCSRSIERAVQALPGVERVDVNVATARVSVEWNSSRSGLAQILDAVTNAGFRPVPLAGEASEVAFQRERRVALKRIGLAGLGMMQVMMYVLGVYVANPESIDPAIASVLRYTGMLITTPVLLYSGAPFLQGAWNDIRRRALGMDVPVALALLLAFGASVFNTVRGAGQTYFDSVTMFIFFLSAGRYVEMVVRQRSLSLSEAVGRSLPARATRVKADGTTERVPLRDIVAGNVLMIPRGAVIPVDAELASGTALVDESLVTGESKPEQKIAAGAACASGALLGGSVNVGAAIRVIARRDLTSSTLASVVALLERAQSARPQISRAADRIANYFVGSTLVLSVIVVLAWVAVDPSRAFPAALAVLVVTCPCALSLATPVAVAAAATRLARSGLLVTRADALERLAGVDAVVMDKTGTLTSGRMTVMRTMLLSRVPAHCEAQVLAIAGALECGSAHPIAAAFRAYESADVIAAGLEERDGLGIRGIIDGLEWRLGQREFVSELAAGHAMGDTDLPADAVADIGVCLGNAAGIVAVFELGEDIRPEARAAVSTLRSLGVDVIVASGDQPTAVDRVGRELGIGTVHARLTPERKVDLVRSLQSQGRRVLTVGDGVNDGPVLAVSDVSCAMGQGSAIAQAAADFLLLNDSLNVVADGIGSARRMLGVIQQNLRWSLFYNLAAVPLAAFDLVPPWLAAIGMSASSLVVVLNARRLAGAGKAS